MATDIECVLPRPDIEELHDAVNTEFSKRLLGGAPVLPLSSEDILAFIMAGTVNLMHGFVTQSLKEQDPETMCCDNLVVYAAKRGINLLGATRAKGYVAITGDEYAGIPASLRFVGESSREYKLDPEVTFNPVHLSANGDAVVRVVASIAGAIFNLGAGNLLTVSQTVPGINIDATVVGNGLTGGSAQENCEALRRRVITAEAASVLSLNEAWFLTESMKYPGVTRVCTEACEGCCDPTFITLYPFMEGVYGDVREPDYGVPPCAVLEEMTLWMFGREPGRGQGLAPIGIRGQYRQACPVALNVTADCFSGCAIGAENRIRDELWNYLRYGFCVGSTVCKDQLRAIIYRALGPDHCMSNVQFSYGEVGVLYEDSANLYLDCGWFFVVGDITLRVTYGVSAASTMRAVPAPAHRAKQIRAGRR